MRMPVKPEANVAVEAEEAVQVEVALDGDLEPELDAELGAQKRYVIAWHDAREASATRPVRVRVTAAERGSSTSIRARGRSG